MESPAIPEPPATVPPRSGHSLLRGWLLVLGVFLFATIWGGASFGLQDNNEGLYAECAREMMESGDWIVPHLNYNPYLEKPPLLYWCVAASFKVFGIHEWAVRLVPVLFFAGTLAAMAALGALAKRPWAAVATALMLITAGGFLVMSRSLLFDVPLTCVLSWAMVALFAWMRSGRRRMILSFHALLALGVLTKGPVILVLAGGTAVFAVAWMRRSLKEVIRISDPVAIAVFFLIATPWHVLTAIREPGFAWFYFINEHVLRFLNMRVPRDYYHGPAYYYLLRLPLYLGFWTPFLPLAVKASRGNPGNASEPDRMLRALLWAWFLIEIGFFTLSGGKANYYLMSAIPSLSFLIALGWPFRPMSDARSRLLLAGSVVLLALTFMLPPALWVMIRRDATADMVCAAAGPLIWATLAAAIVLAAGVVIAHVKGRGTLGFALTATLGILPLLPAPVLLRRFEDHLSQRRLAAFINALPEKGTVILYRDYEKLSSLAFYLARPLPILSSSSGDLLYAKNHGDTAGVFLDTAQVLERANRDRVWLVMQPRYEPELRKRLKGVNLTSRFQSAEALLLSN